MSTIAFWAHDLGNPPHQNEHNALASRVANAEITVAAEDSDSITVSIQLVDGNGDDLAEVGYVSCILSDAATGIGLCVTAPDTVAAGTDGEILLEHVANKYFTVQSEADGDIDIAIGENGADTWYLAVILPDGTHVVSGAITFTV